MRKEDKREVMGKNFPKKGERERGVGVGGRASEILVSESLFRERAVQSLSTRGPKGVQTVRSLGLNVLVFSLPKQRTRTAPQLFATALGAKRLSTTKMWSLPAQDL